MRQIIIGVLLLLSSISYAQEFNTKKLDEFFNSLEKRNEAMGSIVLSKNGKVLYNRSIGIRYGYSGDTDPPSGHVDPSQGFSFLKNEMA